MDRFISMPISTGFEIVVDTGFPDTICGEKEIIQIDKIWKQQLEERKGMLHNGQILCFIAMDANQIIGRFVEYKYYFAQLIDPLLRPILNIEPIAVSGITIGNGKLLIGKRSVHVSDYPGRLELVPSGSIDMSHFKNGRIDYIGQILNELSEEAGILKKELESISPFMLVHDVRGRSYEICVLASVKPAAMDQIPKFTAEYEMLSWWNRDEILLANAEQREFVPLSLHLISLANS